MAYMVSSSRPRGPARPGNRVAKPTRRRALELLADCGIGGCTDAVLLANGETIETMVELVRAGLATAAPHRIRAGRDTIEVAVVRITEAGRKVPAKAEP
jgi:hypothetical protein